MILLVVLALALAAVLVVARHLSPLEAAALAVLALAVVLLARRG